MRPWHRAAAASLALLLPVAAAGADEPVFDASQFEKKPFELGGYVQLRQESLRLRPEGVFYRLGLFGQPQRRTLDRSSATLQLEGKLRHGAGTFDFRTYSIVQRDQLAHDQDSAIHEAVVSLRPTPGLTLEAGKRSLKWGKGYAWNPIGFVERPKDPNDPQLAREGFVMLAADWITSPGGDLQTVAFTPVLVPAGGDVNRDFGSHGHLNPAAKLYLLYRDTDIDFAWQAKGSRPARFGFDFSRNLASNFEVHGEWARILKFPRPVTDSAGRITTQFANATSYLVGLRYLTAGEVTWIAEYFHNGTGYSEVEAQQFYRFADSAFAQWQQDGSSTLVQKAVALSQGSYGRATAGRDYLYVRAQAKDALGIVYFSPSITATVNLQDRSFQLAPELQYTGIRNLELRARLFLLRGGSGTDFGEKQASRRFEVYARYYF